MLQLWRFALSMCTSSFAYVMDRARCEKANSDTNSSTYKHEPHTLYANQFLSSGAAVLILASNLPELRAALNATLQSVQINQNVCICMCLAHTYRTHTYHTHIQIYQNTHTHIHTDFLTPSQPQRRLKGEEVKKKKSQRKTIASLFNQGGQRVFPH